MQGFNMGRYVPPDLEGVASFNQASGTKAQKPTVRFELPFAIWCSTCPKPTIIGQGVRFNATKTKVGSYFSSPIFAFTFRHTACSGTIEIRTDPKNTAYVVTSGATKRDYAEDTLKEGEVRIGGKTTEEKLRLEADPFARLESKVEDRTQAAGEKARIEQLYRRNGRDWEDPGAANAKLRQGFRVERKARERRALNTETLRERMGLGMELLEESEGDKQRAGLIEFGGSDMPDRARFKPLFQDKVDNTGPKPESKNGSKELKEAQAIARQKETLSNELGFNTRAALDPFLDDARSVRSKDATLPLKRKRARESPPKTHPTSSVPLVDYDTD